MRFSSTFLFVFCFQITSISQSNSGDLEQYVGMYIDNLPGSSGDDFQEPSTQQLADWETMIESLLADDLTSARSIADSLNYQIVAYTQTPSGELHYVVEELTPSIHFWGMYLFNANPCRENLILQAPHPKFDFNTGKQAAFSYVRLSNLALFVPGTHRCNNSTSSTCSGTTSVCLGSSAPFQISDNAHTVLSVFQRTTEVINGSNDDAVFVQLHGFSKLATDPYVIMSNGTRDTPVTDYVDLIRAELVLIDPTLTFELAHINLAWTRLIAFSNTQGRLINSSSSPCDTHLDVSSGKFVHIEQEKTKLRDDSIGWNKIYSALAIVFPCNSTAEISEVEATSIYISPNPVFGNELTIHGDELTNYTLIDLNGNILLASRFSATSSTQIDVSSIQKGLYLLVLISNDESITQKIIRF
ncbi:MAG: hypothetical protein ACI837_001463 [Crocinitomicaceae bacterium]|jgi:hypothetical protein